MHYPTIGITCFCEYGKEGKPSEQCLDDRYSRVIRLDGAIPLLIPVIENNYKRNYELLAQEYVKKIGGLLLSGGRITHNKTPRYRYGEKVALKKQDKIRYEWERRLLVYAIKMKKPILGICRGHQMIAEYAGLSLTPFKRNHDKVNHIISVVPNTVLSKIFRKDKLVVNSTHKQLVIYNKQKLNKKFIASAFSKDGYVEAIESRDGLTIGAQCHPERIRKFQPLFKYFISFCKKAP